MEIKITSDLIWQIIRSLNPQHEDFPITVRMLARYAREILDKKEDITTK